MAMRALSEVRKEQLVGFFSCCVAAPKGSQAYCGVWREDSGLLSKPTPVPLPGESYGLRSLAGYSPWGRKKSDTLVKAVLRNEFGEGNGNPLQYFCLENPMDRGAWRATVHGVAKSQTRLSNYPRGSTAPPGKRVSGSRAPVTTGRPGTTSSEPLLPS